MRAVHETLVNATPADVWRALTDPEWTERWYFECRIAGDWRLGGTVVYRTSDGTELESGVVIDLDKERKLTLETRFVWEDKVRVEPPHRTVWELFPEDSGTRVRVTFDVPDEAAETRQVLGKDEDAALEALRIALDPVEQARLARRETIGEIEFRDVTADLVADYQRFFDEVAFQDNPAWRWCYCAETHFAAAADSTGLRNRAEMTDLIASGGVTALLAYDNGEPVAWCDYGETTRLAGVIHKLGLEPRDHEKVGSVACFVIAAQYRRHGLAKRLLEAAIERLKVRGCIAVEAYPRQESGTDAASYRGPREMYVEAGFEPYREAGTTLIMRKSLT